MTNTNADFNSPVDADVKADSTKPAEAIPSEPSNNPPGKDDDSMSTFLAYMCHEIRTPLNSIIGISELLRERNLDQESQDLVALVSNAGETLLRIINGVLDLSRLEANRLKLETVPFSLAEQIQSCFSLVKLEAKKKNIELQESLQLLGTDQFQGDPTALRLILINLVNNAIKFSNGGTVSVQVREVPTYSSLCEDARITVSVSDEGIGFSESEKDQIFESFKQAGNDIKRRYGGTGLGLTITKKLIELMDGRIWAESVEGKGSTFFFTITLKKGDLSAAFLPRASFSKVLPVNRNEDSMSDRSLQGRPLRILMADDALESRMIFGNFLKKSPHNVTFVENGWAAVQRFKQEPFDVVFLDVQMPLLTGYDAAKEIRDWEQSQKKKGTIIVAFTANGFEEDFRESREAGCNAHIVKPIQKAKLLEMLEGFSQRPC